METIRTIRKKHRDSLSERFRSKRISTEQTTPSPWLPDNRNLMEIVLPETPQTDFKWFKSVAVTAARHSPREGVKDKNKFPRSARIFI